jgi:hypothetical protein
MKMYGSRKQINTMRNDIPGASLNRSDFVCALIMQVNKDRHGNGP